MKKISVIVLVVASLLFAAYAEAAKPKRRTRNANRVGPYAGALIGMSHYTGDQSESESILEDQFNGLATQNLTIGTDDKDVGYAAQFGYRFNRYMAAEFALVQYGDLKSTATAGADLGLGGFTPVAMNLNFHTGGPELAAVGILPLNDRFELFGRVGVLFASSERQLAIKVNGQTVSFGSSKGDSTEVVYGAGAAFHVNQMFTIRAMYQKLDKVGDPNRTGTEDITTASLGLIVRF